MIIHYFCARNLLLLIVEFIKKNRDKRTSLLRATMELVNNHGFQDATMFKIAKVAGVAPGTIYLYFENKEDLINKVYLDVKRVLGSRALSGFSEQLPVKKGFEVIWNNIAGYGNAEMQYMRFLAQCEHSPMISEEIRLKASEEMQPLFNLWKRGQNEGIIKVLPDAVLFAFTICPLYFLHSVSRMDTCQFSEVDWREVTRVAWDSIKT